MSPIHDTPLACLSTELIPLIPVAEKNIRPIKEVLEFPSSEVYVPHNIYRWVRRHDVTWNGPTLLWPLRHLLCILPTDTQHTGRKEMITFHIFFLSAKWLPLNRLKYKSVFFKNNRRGVVSSHWQCARPEATWTCCTDHLRADTALLFLVLFLFLGPSRL